MALRTRTFFSFATLAAVCVGPSMLVACGSNAKDEPPGEGRVEGQTEFISAPPNGMSGGARNGDFGAPSAEAGGTASPSPSGTPSIPAPSRKVEETDLYRLDGDRLYYLNSYRGLMVFDVSDVTKPKLLGRSPIFGHPVEMIVRGGIANVVVADWYGTMDDGAPFHGSIVRGIDARDPLNIRITGEAKLGGWVRDTRVVGDVIYAVSEDYGWYYGYDGYSDSVTTSTGSKVLVSAVSFAGGTVRQTGKIELPGYGGVFYVNSSSIMLAHDVVSDPSAPYSSPTGKTELLYVDISDPLGTIRQRGKITVNGRVQGWGADNGRWNLDFGNERHAHTIGCGNTWCGGEGSNFILATADFTNPDAPTLSSELTISGTAWTPTARFVDGRMYLSPSADYWYGSSKEKTPIQIYNTADPKNPTFAGQTEISGSVWLFMPSSGNKLFALGNEYAPTGPYYDSSKVSLRYLDVTNPSAPFVIGTSSFGEGWAWTPAAGTFKAFTKDDTQGLVVLPFSGWSSKSGSYNNGLQLIEFNATSIRTAGAAKTKGWVERGIFVKGKLVSLSDMALSVVDYADRANPRVIAELALARNVVDAQPQGSTIAQLSSDWWDNDLTKSELRVLPIGDAEENKSLDGALATATLEGYNARIFRNGDLAYVVTDVREKVSCPTAGGGTGEPRPAGDYGAGDCWAYTQKVQVVDLAAGRATLKGSIKLPLGTYGGYWWGYHGCYAWDWYNGADVVQVQGDALAFRRWQPVYSPDGKYEETKHALYVVDLKNADAPKVASTAITTDPWGWWGNMRVAGNTLYVSHYEWLEKPDPAKWGSSKYYVKYYLDPIDLTDRNAPRVGTRINVPGIMVGASQTDPSLVYTVDYRWYGDTTKDEFAVVKISGDKAYLQGTTLVDGYVGQVFVQGNKAYASAQKYSDGTGTYKPTVQLHEIDVTNPKAPIDRVSTEKKGWGWLLGVAGDRAVVTSGWYNAGVDIYKLSSGSAPVYEQFVRTRGWWGHSMSRQGNQLFLASGYWGVQTINL